MRRRGFLVVDEAVGIARGFRETEAEPRLEFTREQRSCVFSAGKPIVAIAVALLEERGAIDVERPVASYWPEFGRAGKGDITVLDILLHRSGLYLREVERDWRRFGDWDFIRHCPTYDSPRAQVQKDGEVQPPVVTFSTTRVSTARSDKREHPELSYLPRSRPVWIW